TTTREHIKNLYAYKNSVFTYDSPSFTNETNWNNQYYTISLCSNILSEITIATDNVEKQKQLIGEARVHRAYAYLILINTFAVHYNEATAATDKEVPIINNPTPLLLLTENQ
ncbi:MAG: RagB/SusD family nutrient uptake outer membrane protein, partial [Bacteroidales bacterium]|nr:RagB/SusD family nutrient uptake outer membrane protein [Bacteroidales bacterium]